MNSQLCGLLLVVIIQLIISHEASSFNSIARFEVDEQKVANKTWEVEYHKWRLSRQSMTEVSTYGAGEKATAILAKVKVSYSIAIYVDG